jgi:hypothetical protein
MVALRRLSESLEATRRCPVKLSGVNLCPGQTKKVTVANGKLTTTPPIVVPWPPILRGLVSHITHTSCGAADVPFCSGMYCRTDRISICLPCCASLMLLTDNICSMLNGSNQVSCRTCKSAPYYMLGSIYILASYAQSVINDKGKAVGVGDLRVSINAAFKI